MKKYSILTLLAAVFMGFSATSCDDYLDVNKNEDAPDYIDGYLYLAGIEQAYQGIYYDNRALTGLTQMTCTGYTNFRDHYYTSGSDAAGEMWRTVYWLQGMNLENMINQSLAAKNWHLAGIGYLIKAYSWDWMTKYHGEMPMKEAFVAGLLSHDYDYQEAIYAQVRAWAKEGIRLLNEDDKTTYGSKISANDYIYKGDIEKWKKFGYYVIVRNLASLTKKNDFKTKYYPELKEAATKAFASNADNATLTISGKGSDEPYTAYNNFWGTTRENLSWSYFQHEYPAQIMTGTVPYYDENGNKITIDGNRSKYELATKQIICDTLVNETGHWDPRAIVKLGTSDGNHVGIFEEIDSIKAFKVYGGVTSVTSTCGHDVATFYHTNSGTKPTFERCGKGRWIYRDDAPYILGTYAELLFDLAEAQWYGESKEVAFETWKKAVAADMEFTEKYLVAGSVNESGYHQGDKISAAQFNEEATEYLAGPYVGALSIDDFSLSHIMMQKFVALYPWGAAEAWVDQRKYHYDIEYTGDVPSQNNGWDVSIITHKKDEDPNKVYKGYYLRPAQVQNRKASFNSYNEGSPCYRVRPRYNSEYMWNKPSLDALKPISGLANNYHCSMPWFAYPGDQPGAPTYDEVAE